MTTGFPMGVPPAGVVTRRTVAEAADTQSVHWNPTGAATMHCGHTGRPQRVQRTPVAWSGCRGQTGKDPDAGVGSVMLRASRG